MLQVTGELRIVDEFLMLVLDYDSGRDRMEGGLTAGLRSVAFAGAVLVDLALRDRIDTDLERLVVTDPTPLGDELLDSVLAEIHRHGGKQEDTASWITRLAGRSDEIRNSAYSRLIDQGILEADSDADVALSPEIARVRSYQSVDGQVVEDVQLRIMRALFGEEIPEPRDIVIVTLAAACGTLEVLLSRDELARVQPRIDLISRLDLIGREVTAAIVKIDALPSVDAPSALPPSEIPEAARLPLLGNAVALAGDLGAFLRDQYQQHGPVFSVRAFRHRLICLVGPEANVFASNISATHFRSWEPYHDFIASFGAHRAALTMDGPEHIRLRQMLAKGYSPKMLEANLEMVNRISQEMADRWPVGQPLSLQRAMQRMTSEQIGLYSTSISSGEYFDDLLYFLETSLKINVSRRLPKVMERLPRYRRAKRRVVEFYHQIIAEHQSDERQSEDDFVDVLLEVNRSDPQLLPETDLMANVLSPFAVGMDTTASVSAFMIYTMLQHPELMDQVRDEVDTAYRNGPLSLKNLRSMEITHRVAIETLRMYPIMPALARIVSNSFEFGGYRIPAGSTLLLGTTVPHHLPECFADPDRFDIERGVEGRAEYSRPGAFAPFGLGRHRCIGSSLSELQIMLTVAAVARSVEVELERPGRPMKTKQSPAFHLDDSVQFRVVRRRTP